MVFGDGGRSIGFDSPSAHGLLLKRKVDGSDKVWTRTEAFGKEWVADDLDRKFNVTSCWDAVQIKTTAKTTAYS